MRLMFIIFLNFLFHQTSKSYVSLFIMAHGVGPMTESDIGPLPSRYSDSELPEDRKTERMHGNLVSPVNTFGHIYGDLKQVI